MSDEIIINITPDPSINISAIDSNEEIALSGITLNQGLINHSVTHQKNGSDELLHNLLGGLNGGQSGEYYHMTQNEHANNVYRYDLPVYQTGDQIISGTKSFADNLGLGVIAPTAKLDILDTTLAGSGSLSGSALNIAQTWNTTGTPTAIKLNVTDTASNAASLLADFQVGGVSRFRVTKNGFEFRAATIFAGIGSDGTGRILLNPSTTGGVRVSGDLQIGLSDTVLARDGAANTLAQRNGTNAQTFRLYNTFTNTSNYERGFLRWNSNVLQIGTEAAGSGSARNLELQQGGVSILELTSSALLPVGTSRTVNLGSGATRQFKTISTESIVFGGNLDSIIASGSSGYLDIKSNYQGTRIMTATAGVAAMTVLLTGNVGIGTSSPTSKLEIAAADGTHIELSDTLGNPHGTITAGSSKLTLGSFNNGVVYSGGGNFGIGTTSPAVKLDVVGSIRVSSGEAYKSAGDLYLDAANNASTYFRDGSTVNAVITNTGNVGIGTTSPASKLTITDGDAEITNSANGVILKSPNGTRYRITVNDSGVLTTTAV